MHFNQNIVFLVVVAIFAIFRGLANVVQRAKREDQGTTSAKPIAPVIPPRAEPKTDEARVREFLEALGQPTSAAPPPPVVPRSDIPPRPLAPVEPPEMRPFTTRRSAAEKAARRRTFCPAPNQRADPAPNVILPLQPEVIGVEERRPAPRLPGKATRPLTPTQPISSQLGGTESWRNLLTSPSTLRQAVILREIFGPPLALQRLER